MKMTREQVADLLLKANDDLSNVECLHSCDWSDTGARDVPEMLFHIVVDNDVYRIKDNAVKEVTKDLRGKWCRDKLDNKHSEYAIIAIDYDTKMIYIDDEWCSIKEFNERWQLVED